MGDSIDCDGDNILAGSYQPFKCLEIYSFSMRKKMFDIEFVMKQKDAMPDCGFLFGAKYSKDDSKSLIFAGGGAKNELKVFENNTEDGQFRQLGQATD